MVALAAPRRAAAAAAAASATPTTTATSAGTTPATALLPRSRSVVGEVLARVANPPVGPESPIETLDADHEEMPKVWVRLDVRVDVVHKLPEPHGEPVVRSPRVWIALVDHCGRGSG